MMTFTAKSYGLGQSGTLVELHVPPPSDASACRIQSTPVIILDQVGAPSFLLPCSHMKS